MPELPEVETLCRQLREVVTGEKILEAKTLDAKLGRLENLAGRTMLTPFRTGKGLNLPLDNKQTLKLHLRMSGRLLWQKEPVALPHTRWVLTFKQGRLALIDPRRFATLTLQVDSFSLPAGADPLGEFPSSCLQESAAKRKLPVKAFLLDQRAVAGIGNIYACEILYHAAINPRRATGELSRSEWQKIGRTAREVLTKAIACRGTSISDWRDLFGQPGEYQHCLQVYGREGESCFRCGIPVTRLKLGGRGTYFCHACQQ